ncbi:MAG: hypothetical protein CSA53_06630 [Gammaproteobacteria bacterium]|nr:MAG: hypothetical protein CSA53_06630 [Gammaproteobacteria bacterium]
MILTLATYLCLGAFAGVIAGLFGIGGGLLIVPVLVFSFGFQGVSDNVATHAAIATSLACIVVTSISSTLAHQRHGAVRWDVFRYVAPGLILGAFLGARIAGVLSGTELQIALGIFVLFMAAQMMWNLIPTPTDASTPRLMHSGAGAFIGTLSSLFGIGGGVINVSYLHWRGMAIASAVATSAACGIPIALAATATNAIEGWGHPAMPSYSLGYIYLPALIGITLTSTPCARLGANLAHAWPPKLLKRVFALFLIIVGMYFLLRNV